MTQQQTERDEALIAEKKRLAVLLEALAGDCANTDGWEGAEKDLLDAAALLRGDEPAKPVDDEEPMVPRDVAESWKARADNLKEDRENLLSDLAIMMSKHVENWPEPKRFSTAIALLDKILSEALGKSLPEPAKPDRYVVAAREFLAAWGERVLAVDQGEYDGDKRFQAAAAVLRRHFEPPVRVIQAARCLKDGSPKGGSAELCADFILKGDV